MKKQIVLMGLLAFFSGSVFAAAGTGSGLDWEPGLALLVTSMTGPFAFTAAVSGMAIAGGILVFGSDLNAFGRTMIYLILVIGFLVTAVSMMTKLFGVGAVFTVLPTTIVALCAIGLFVVSGVFSAIQLSIVKLIRRNKQTKVVTA